MKILFIGSGNMGSAIIGGILKKKVFSVENVFIFEINKGTKDKVIKKFKVNELPDINDSIKEFDVIVISVKPQVFKNFINDNRMSLLPNLINKNQLIVSIMAGITIENIQRFFKDSPVIRVMPNTPALIGKGMTVISPSERADGKDVELAKNIFSSVGEIEVLDEKYMDAVTALSGSGPAYVFTFIESLVQGGVLCGLSKEVSIKLVKETIYGSVLMVEESKNIEELRHNVTSPAGTTIEALTVLEKNNFRYALIEAVRAAKKRSEELGK